MTPAPEHTPLDIDALFQAGHACSANRQWPEARRHFEQALTAALHADTPVQEIHARSELVRLDILDSDAPGAMRQAQRCAVLACQIADAASQARALVTQAFVSNELGEMGEALGVLEAALPHARTSGDPWVSYNCCNLMGSVLNELGQPEAAMRWYTEARDHALRAERRLSAELALANATSCWVQIGNQAQAAGHAARSVDAWQRAVQACDKAAASAVALGFHDAEFVALGNRAEALAKLGDTEAALADFRDAAALCASVGEMTSAIQLAVPQAQLLQSTGQHAAAREVALAAIAQAQALGSRRSLDSLHEIVSAIDAERGDFASALHHHRQMFEVYRAVASDQAAQRAQVMAVRLETERAVAEAKRERHRSFTLEAANAALSDQAAALSEEAMRDALTGLANRRRLDARLAQLHADATRRDVPLCVALLDIDHFKSINDGYSHAMGDRVLRHVGEILGAACRGDDLAARYGGEEFVLVFDGVGLSRAADICDRVRRSIQEFGWSELASGLAVTASIGVCDIASSPTPAQGLIRADALMYEAKAAGRNCIRAGADVEPCETESS